MRCATEPPARLLPIAAGGLPRWCDAYLAPPGGAFFAGRLWYDVLLAHALPAGAAPWVAVCGTDDALLLPLLRDQAGRLRSLTTPYSLEWRPLARPGTDAAGWRAGGRAFGRLLRGGPPARLDTLDAAAPVLAPFARGLRDAGLAVLRYDHFGNWHEALPPDLDWAGYLEARPPALRTTIRRKLARAAREGEFELITAPGPTLEAGIAAYEDVRARSWKPLEPSPGLDAALARAAAGAGLLRLGVLRARAGGQALAAQYWVLEAGGAGALLLKLAHAEAARGASPGTALTALMVRGLLAEGVRTLDFGVGDDAYKRLWVGCRRGRIGLAVVDPRHPAGLWELARHAAGRLRAHWSGTRAGRRRAAPQPVGEAVGSGPSSRG